MITALLAQLSCLEMRLNSTERHNAGIMTLWLLIKRYKYGVKVMSIYDWCNVNVVMITALLAQLSSTLEERFNSTERQLEDVNGGYAGKETLWLLIICFNIWCCKIYSLKLYNVMYECEYLGLNHVDWPTSIPRQLAHTYCRSVFLNPSFVAHTGVPQIKSRCAMKFWK